MGRGPVIWITDEAWRARARPLAEVEAAEWRRVGIHEPTPWLEAGVWDPAAAWALTTHGIDVDALRTARPVIDAGSGLGWLIGDLVSSGDLTPLGAAILLGHAPHNLSPSVIHRLHLDPPEPPPTPDPDAWPTVDPTPAHPTPAHPTAAGPTPAD